MNEFKESLDNNSSFKQSFLNIIPGVKSMVFFTLFQSGLVLAENIEHVVDKDENAWRIVINETKSLTLANKFEGQTILPGDKFIFSDTKIEIIRDGKSIFSILLSETSKKEKPRNKTKILNQKKQEIKQEQEVRPKIISNKNPKNHISYDSFIQLSKMARFILVTKPVKDGYYKIHFPNNELANKVTLDDIIPDEYSKTFLIRDKEIRYKNEEGEKKVQESAYFNILGRDENGKFHSLFSGKKYDESTIILDGFLIKPFNKEINDKDNTLFDSKTQTNAYNNEILIKNIYGEDIKKIIDLGFVEDSVIDEDFFYSIIARESAFDPNALSPTSTRGLCMITINTVKEILLQNITELNKLKKNNLDNFNRKVVGGNYNLQELNSHDYDFIFELNDFIPVGKNIKLHKNGDDYYLKGINTKMYVPETSFHLSLNYLRYLESQFTFIDDKNFRKEVIVMSYNMGPGIIKYILTHDKTLTNRKKLLLSLKEIILEEEKFNGIFKGKLTLAKFNEVKGYLISVMKFNKSSDV